MERILKALTLSAAVIGSMSAMTAKAADGIIKPGTTYSATRKQLLSRGYAPIQFPKRRCLDNVSGRTFICEAYPETTFCSGTGFANCQFAFRGPKGELLLVETQGEEQATAGHDIGLDLGVKQARLATSSERNQLPADGEDKVQESTGIRSDMPKGFIFRSQDVYHSTNRGRSVRLGEKIAPQALKKRFSGYEVRYTKGEDCLTCAVISGVGGQFEVSFAQDGRTIVDIRSYDGHSHDAQGNSVGSSLLKAIGSTSAQCDARMDTTCASPSLKGLSYIVANDDRCPITVREKQPTEIPPCARIAGFQILGN